MYKSPYQHGLSHKPMQPHRSVLNPSTGVNAVCKQRSTGWHVWQCCWRHACGSRQRIHPCLKQLAQDEACGVTEAEALLQAASAD